MPKAEGEGTVGKTQVFKADSLDWVVWLQQDPAVWPRARCLTSEAHLLLWVWTGRALHRGSLGGQSLLPGNSAWGTPCPVCAVCQGCAKSPLPDVRLTPLRKTKTSALTGSFVVSCPHLGRTKRGRAWNLNSYSLPVTTQHRESYGENPDCNRELHTLHVLTKLLLSLDVSLTQNSLGWRQMNIAILQDLSPIFYKNNHYTKLITL